MTGIMLDTTWFVLQNYVTSFPTLIAGNVGIPIGFTFSLIEDSSIYNGFFDIFEDVLSFKIPVLKFALNSQNLTQIFCLRHFLSSLGTSEYSCQIGNISYEINWSKIKDEEKSKNCAHS